MTQDDEQRALEAYCKKYPLRFDFLRALGQERRTKILESFAAANEVIPFHEFCGIWESCLQSKASEGLKEFLKDFPEIESDHDNTGFVLSPTPKASETAGDGWKLVPVEPTEKMWIAARQIILYAETPGRNFEGLRAHLVECGIDYLAWFPVWATQELGHLNKHCIAVLIYHAMLAAAPKPPETKP